MYAGRGHLRCTLPGKDMDTQGRIFESGVAVGRYCSYSKTPFVIIPTRHPPPDVSTITPTPPAQNRLFTRLLNSPLPAHHTSVLLLKFVA